MSHIWMKAGFMVLGLAVGLALKGYIDGNASKQS